LQLVTTRSRSLSLCRGFGMPATVIFLQLARLREREKNVRFIKPIGFIGVIRNLYWTSTLAESTVKFSQQLGTGLPRNHDIYWDNRTESSGRDVAARKD
jgi:hypothetical protein